MSILGVDEESSYFEVTRPVPLAVQLMPAPANENLPPIFATIQYDLKAVKADTDFSLGDGRSMRASDNFLGWQIHAKRVFDIAMSGVALIALLPLFILVAVAILVESRGPVFFVQQREGKAGTAFKAFKFRSMRRDDCDETGIRQTIEGDSRITKFGRLMRRTSIDELPQLINVLRGDMSLVGPRPHVKNMLAAGQDYRVLVPYFDLRLLVTPGLTGLAQASGLRGPTTNAHLARLRIDADLHYIETFSLWLDIKIIAQTFNSELLGGTGH